MTPRPEEVARAFGEEPADPYADVPPPSETDGPAEPVDWRELEDDGHGYDHTVGEAE